jgi:hypothetical protein
MCRLYRYSGLTQGIFTRPHGMTHSVFAAVTLVHFENFSGRRWGRQGRLRLLGETASGPADEDLTNSLTASGPTLSASATTVGTGCEPVVMPGPFAVLSAPC